MRKIDSLTAIIGLFVILFLLYVNSQNINNVISVIFIVVFAFAFFSINTINSMVLKVAIFIIVFFLIVAITSFFYSSGSIYPDYGTNILLPQLDLETNKESKITKIEIPVSRKPSSPVYTYSFSTYVKEDSKNVSDPNKKYLFYRNASPDETNIIGHDLLTNISTEKQFGLKLGLGSNYNYLFLNVNLTITTQTSLEPSEGTTSRAILITDKFPMNKWTTITITVNNNVTNVFIGTTLIKSIKIDNLSAPSSTSPIEFGNMPAHLANFSYSPSIIEPTPSYIQYMTSHE